MYIFYRIIIIIIIIHTVSDTNIQYYTHLIYLLTAVGLTPGGNSTVHIYIQTIHRTTLKQNIQSETYITIRILKLTQEYIT
jgi:hypothetical protein